MLAVDCDDLSGCSGCSLLHLYLTSFVVFIPTSPVFARCLALSAADTTCPRGMSQGHVTLCCVTQPCHYFCGIALFLAFLLMIPFVTGAYVFQKFEAWQHLGLTPDPIEAMKLLHRLAADPGIAGIMTKHRWSVGLLSEMPPEGKVGVSPVCILGVNINAGQEISLRIRTDDLKGFRRHAAYLFVFRRSCRSSFSLVATPYNIPLCSTLLTPISFFFFSALSTWGAMPGHCPSSPASSSECVQASSTGIAVNLETCCADSGLCMAVTVVWLLHGLAMLRGERCSLSRQAGLYSKRTHQTIFCLLCQAAILSAPLASCVPRRPEAVCMIHHHAGLLCQGSSCWAIVSGTIMLGCCVTLA